MYSSQNCSEHLVSFGDVSINVPQCAKKSAKKHTRHCFANGYDDELESLASRNETFGERANSKYIRKEMKKAK